MVRARLFWPIVNYFYKKFKILKFENKMHTYYKVVVAVNVQ